VAALAGLGSVAVMLLLRLLAPWPSYFDLAGERLVGATPGATFDIMLERLQHWGKPALLLGIIVLSLIVLAGAGWAYRRLAASLAGAGPRWLTALGLGLALWAMTSWALGAFAQPWPSNLQSGGGALVSFLAFAVILAGLESGPAPDVGRRRFMAGLGSLALLLNGGLLWRLVSAMLEPRASGTHVPTGAVTSSDVHRQLFASVPGLMPQITDNDTFYRISKNFVDPTVPADSWALEVFGLVEQPRRLSYAELQALPAVDEMVTLECISNLVGGPLAGNAIWTGVPLSTILQAAQLKPEAKFVAFTCSDNYTESYPVDKALAPSTILAYAMNGSPLPQRHGFPLRVLSTGRYGMKNPKWLRKIELTAEPRPGWWERQGYDDDAVVRTMSRIDVPPAGVPLPAGKVVLGGIAFAGERGISAVEVSIDGGASWRTAVLDRPPAPAAWARWLWPWPDAAPGRYQALVRATDGAGAPQTADRQGSFPAGATGYDQVEVVIQ